MASNLELYEKWFKKLSGYCEDYEQRSSDKLYWWTERSMIGGLAAAAERMKWVTCQEFQDKKWRGKGAGKGKKNGRVDLWINPFKKSPSGWALEAKFLYAPMQKLGSEPKWRSTIESAWNEAVKDAKKLETKFYNKRLAVLFVSFYSQEKLPPETDWRNWKRLQKSVIKESLDDYKFIGIHNCRGSGLKLKSVKNYYYPGFAMILGEV